MKKMMCMILTISICYITMFECTSIADDYIEELSENEIQTAIQTSSNIEELDLNSRIAVSYDRLSGKVIWGKNENRRTAMASTTKIMTAIVVIENANLKDIVEVSAKAALTGGSRLGLKKGDKVAIKDLLYGLMLRSGNDAAVALAEYVGGDNKGFADLMNKKATDLNLKDTHFVTPHGLDDAEHYTTAYELAKIADYALKNEIFRNIVGTKTCTININGYPKGINNTNELLGYIDGVYGVKTGFTNNAGRCLVTSVKRGDFDIITVVIQADTKKDRTKDSINLINYIFNNYQRINLDQIVDKEFERWSDINKNRININKARDNIVHLERETLTNEYLIVKKTDVDNINVQINALYEFEAPISKGDIAGELKIYIKNELAESKKIVFCNDIEKKCVWDYAKQCFQAIKL